jgi:large conductance mechanosensitive channel
MGGFRKFLMRGNLIDLAVAVVIAVAFNAVVQAFIQDLITPLIAAFGQAPNFARLSFTINHSHFRYGSFVNALLSFLVIAGVVYCFLVMPSTRLSERVKRRQEATERECPECLSVIPIAARRCRFCTAHVTPPGPPRPAEPANL